MDTIQIKLSVLDGGDLTNNEIDNLRSFINHIKSPNGYNYCDFLDTRKGGDIGVKISYPRYFNNSNVFLIRDNKQVLEVNEHFCRKLNNHDLLKNSYIYLERLDIPFTYYKNEKHNFHSYLNIFMILGEVYNKRKENGIQKAYSDLLTKEYETITYADSKTKSSYNSKVTVYNQYENIKTKTADEDELKYYLDQFGDLKNRIRIEFSKRIRRKYFSNEEFSKFDILSDYLDSAKKEIFTNLLNFEIIDEVYEEKKELLIKSLKEEKALGNFNYEVAFLKYNGYVHDYEVLRRAFKIFIENDKTRESAITKMRKILNEYSERENIIVIDVYSKLKEIKNSIDSFYTIK